MTVPGDKTHLDRYDLTGRDLRKWRESTKTSLLARLRRLFRKVEKSQLPESTKTIGDQARETPGKVLKLVDSHLDRIPIENRLRQTQTEKAFVETELAKVQIKREYEELRKTRAEANLKELQLYERLVELTKDKPLPKIIDADGNEVVCLADLVQQLSQNRANTLPEAGASGAREAD